MYYTSDYDGDNNPAYVIIGNPIVLSSETYTIYANGRCGNLDVGVIISVPVNANYYGLVECNHQAISRTKYADLFNVIGITNGEGDGETTFNVPDYREVTLVGIGKNTTDVKDSTEGGTQNHDEYNLGEFKDDQVQEHKHNTVASKGNNYTVVFASSDTGYGTFNLITGNVATGSRVGTVTRGKRKGVKYMIVAM